MWRKTMLLIVALIIFSKIQAQYSSNITVETILKTDTTSIGQRIVYPQVDRAEITVLKITMNDGASTGWHKHGIPLLAYILEGELTVQRQDGLTKIFKAGEAVSEMLYFYHQGINTGDKPLVLIAFYLGGDNKPLVTRMEK